MKKKAIIILAEGFEEIEAVTPIDILRRAGIEVCIAGLDPKNSLVTGSRGISIQTDITIDDLTDNFDACILPGGLQGANNLSASERMQALIAAMHKENKIIAAICASPAIVLAPTGVLNGRQATCYPGMENEFDPTTMTRSDAVVVDGNIITSRGPGTAMAFALTIATALVGKSIAETVRKNAIVENSL